MAGRGRHPAGPGPRVTGRGRVGVVEPGVDAVVDHVDPRRVDGGVGAEHVGAHRLADGDDRVGSFVRRALRPARQPVAAAELLCLPRPVRLERVGGDHVGDAVQRLGPVAGHVGVPGVGVHHGGLGAPGRHLQVSREHPQGGVGAGQRGVVLGVRGGVVARCALQWTSTSTRWRSSRTRKSTWAPAPPYTSGGTSRVRSPTRRSDVAGPVTGHGPFR